MVKLRFAQKYYNGICILIINNILSCIIFLGYLFVSKLQNRQENSYLFQSVQECVENARLAIN